MRVVTLKAKPKTIFGLIMAITGLIVILITFVGNHNGAVESNANAKVSCSTVDERKSYITSLGWTIDGNELVRDISIPANFNEVYTQYNKIQKEQGFNLEDYKGKNATIYTYNISNYQDNDNVIADLIVYDGTLIGADLCDTNVENGFLIALVKNEKIDGQN